ncbi:MAG: hypothetical protein ACO3SO_01765 [Luteolibacter sp.]
MRESHRKREQEEHKQLGHLTQIIYDSVKKEKGPSCLPAPGDVIGTLTSSLG